MMRICVLVMACACLGLGAAPKTSTAAEPQPTTADRYLDLGTPQGELGGADQKSFEHEQLKAQIKTFIPPLLRPAFVEHAFVLPPNAYSIAVSQRFTSLGGGDFFLNGNANRAVFEDFKLDRHLTDIDLFYGFDFNREYLHDFTVKVNVPYVNTSIDGFIHPDGQQFISIENAAGSSAIGDVGLFLKKKLWDQGNRPFGLAVVGGIFLPTGSNHEKFGSGGRVTTKRPTPPSVTAAQGFDAVAQQNVQNGTWGDGKCFFRNFNLANRALCDGPAAGIGGAFGAPAAAVESFSPGGANFNNAFVGDFPFNNGVFGRFADDGRLPSTLQPGTGRVGYLLGIFLTRQFAHTGLLGRSAVHLGVAHQFVTKKDDIDFGDTTTYFASFVKPIYKDYLALDLTFVGFDHRDDHYSGKIPEPNVRTCDATDVAAGVGGCGAVGDRAFVFDLGNRPAFSGGFTGMVAPSLIFSPDPQIRVTLSGLYRVINPDLGPAPPWVVRAGLEVIF